MAFGSPTFRLPSDKNLSMSRSRFRYLCPEYAISSIMVMGKIFVHHGTIHGERRLPEPTVSECETIRLHNWMERAPSSTKKTSVKTDLAETTAEMGKVTDTRELERAIPKSRYTTDIGLTKMSLGVKYIAAKLTGQT